jgi:hypothetical protein
VLLPFASGFDGGLRMGAFQMKPTLIHKGDLRKHVNEVMKKFRHDEVLIGIPAETTKRNDQDPINNASLMAIANFGSPAQNIPPWPILKIGIMNAQEQISKAMRAATLAGLKKGFTALGPYFERVGIIASNSVKKVLNSQEDVPADKPEESTLAARKREGFKGTKYWLRTGQLRNAITYVVNR